MRKPSTFAFSFTMLLALAGCTSLLGGFEVGPGGSGDAGGGGETGTCTECNGKCVDTATDNANCGQCGMPCIGGQSCQASKCACPADQAFCGGACSKADRQHCGSTCTPCQNDEICASGCVPAAAPSFKTVVRDPSGWKAPNGDAFAIEVTPISAPGTIYECRTGPDAKFTPTEPMWKPCDGAAGTGTKHTPVEDPATPEGTYRTEYRYRNDTYRSPTIFVRYYIHHSLDKVETCPRPGKATDGPHFTDDQYFAAAQQFSITYPSLFPIGSSFPLPSNPPSRNDPIYLAAPFIKIPFTGIANTKGMIGGTGWAAAGGDYLLNERSLRHKYVMNATRTMILERRQYVQPKTGDCMNHFKIGSKGAERLYGPTDAKRGYHYHDCEVIVVNGHGAGLCIGADPMMKAPMVLEIDHKPFTGASIVSGTASAATGGTQVTTTGFTVIASHVNQLVQMPAVGGYWYRITAMIDANNFKINEPYRGPAGAQQWRLAQAALIPVSDMPTAFAKFHEDGGHFYASGAVAPRIPSPKTKCETPGCNTGKPWLTYLPP